MMDFGELERKKPEDGEAEAGTEPSSPPFYDPLMTPWGEPSSPVAASLVEPEEEPVFWSDWPRAVEPPPAEQPPAEPAAAGGGGWTRSWEPAGYERPYYDTEEVGRLRRQIRQGTVAVPSRQRRWSVTVRELLETALLALLIFLAVRASFQNFRVEGASMQPSLEHGEYLIVNKLAYAQIDLNLFDWLPFFDAGDNSKHHLWGAPARGDVIVFRSPTNVQRDFIKRIMGVPGDTIEIRPETGEVLVNGQLVDEPYIGGGTTCAQNCKWTVPPANTRQSAVACGAPACYFVMGDNRPNSSDSRQGWLVPEENIIGKALFTYWHKGGPELGLAPNHSPSLSKAASAEE